MATKLNVCDMDPSLKERLKKFRFRKETNTAALLIKVDMSTQTLVLEEEFEDVCLEEIQEELPASQPRFLVYSYCHKHQDSRKSYPLCFIFISPVGCKPEQQMTYAGSKLSLVNEAGLTKVFELRNPEDLTDEWLQDKVKFFR